MPEQYPEYTSFLACAPGPTFFASSYQTIPPRWFFLVEVVNLAQNNFDKVIIAWHQYFSKYLAS
jgi:hypothetical protein